MSISLRVAAAALAAGLLGFPGILHAQQAQGILAQGGMNQQQLLALQQQLALLQQQVAAALVNAPNANAQAGLLNLQNQAAQLQAQLGGPGQVGLLQPVGQGGQVGRMTGQQSGQGRGCRGGRSMYGQMNGGMGRSLYAGRGGQGMMMRGR